MSDPREPRRPAPRPPLRPSPELSDSDRADQTVHIEGTPPPTVSELVDLPAEQAMLAGAAADGVYVEHRRQRFPVPGTKAERRAERAVSACFLVSGLAALAFIVCFIAVPYHWNLPGRGSQSFKYYTPVLGVTLGIALLGIGIGAVLWAKLLMPEEEVVQDRHDGPSPVEEQLMTIATLDVGLADTGLTRRKMLRTSLGLAGGGLLTLPLIALVGGLIKKPGDQLKRTSWARGVAVVDQFGRRIGPADMQAGGLLTVFPGVPGGTTAGDSPTLLIRLHPGQQVHARKGQAGFQWGDFVAFSKICTHAGCPASLYEQQTSRLLCPCHQSQFAVLEDAKPVFGPATRSLPKLPLGVEIVDGKQYFVARSDYREAIGPGFWERA